MLPRPFGPSGTDGREWIGIFVRGLGLFPPRSTVMATAILRPNRPRRGKMAHASPDSGHPAGGNRSLPTASMLFQAAASASLRNSLGQIDHTLADPSAD